jgi:hypothetical protein
MATVLVWIGVSLLSGAIADPCLAAPKSSETPGEICSKAGGAREKTQCCEEAFNECMRGCSKGESSQADACEGFCDQAVRQPCLREAAGTGGAPIPKPQAPAGAIEETRPGTGKRGIDRPIVAPEPPH